MLLTYSLFQTQFRAIRNHIDLKTWLLQKKRVILVGPIIYAVLNTVSHYQLITDVIQNCHLKSADRIFKGFCLHVLTTCAWLVMFECMFFFILL